MYGLSQGWKEVPFIEQGNIEISNQISKVMDSFWCTPVLSYDLLWLEAEFTT